MKQTLLTICLIVFALPSWGNNVVCNLTGFNCPEIDDFDKLVEVDGILYKKFSNTPFTGNVTDGEQQGFVKEGKKDGSWVEYFSNGTLMEKRNYKDGEKDGLVEFYYKNGQLRDKGNYKEGRLDGLWEYYYENGKLWEKINYKSGKHDGLFEGYYENGQLRAKGNYKDEKEDGLWEYFSEGGSLKETETWINGVKQE